MARIHDPRNLKGEKLATENVVAGAIDGLASKEYVQQAVQGIPTGQLVVRNYYLSMSNPTVPDNSPISAYSITDGDVYIKIAANNTLLGKMYLVTNTTTTEIVVGSNYTSEDSVSDSDSEVDYYYEISFNIGDFINVSETTLLIQIFGS